MTLFKRSNDIEVSVSPEFDKSYKPGETPSRPGIYRCAGCGCEAIADSSKALPLAQTLQALAGSRDNSMAAGRRCAARTALGARKLWTRAEFIGTPSGVWGGPDDLPSWLILSLPLMGCLQQPLATRLSQHELGPITWMVGYNLVFWLLMVAMVTLLVLVATSFEGMHLETTGGPGRIL